MRRIFVLISCMFLTLSAIFATESMTCTGKLPAGKKLGPILLKYFRDGVAEEKSKTNVKSVKFLFLSFDIENDRYKVSGQEIYTQDGTDMVHDVEYILFGDGKKFVMQMLEFKSYEVNMLEEYDFNKQKRMNSICKSSASEIEDCGKKISDAEYSKLLDEINSGRFYSKEILTRDHAKSFFAEDFLIAYWKLSGKKLTRSDYLNFMKACRNKTYLKYHDDEFELENQIDNIKKEVDGLIEKVDLSKSYQFANNITFGKYDFESSGYTISPKEGLVFVMSQEDSRKADKFSDSGREITLEPVNYTDFNFMPMERKDAQKLLDNRKDYGGTVDRNITTIITFHFLPIDSTEQKNASKSWTGKDSIPLAIKIDFIDAFSKLPENIETEYLGEIIKK